MSDKLEDLILAVLDGAAEGKNIVDQYQQLDLALEIVTERRDELEAVIKQRLKALYGAMNSGRSYRERALAGYPQGNFRFSDAEDAPDMIEVEGTYFYSDGDTAGSSLTVPRAYLLGEMPDERVRPHPARGDPRGHGGGAGGRRVSGKEPRGELARYAFGYSDKKPGVAWWLIHLGMFAWVAWHCVRLS